MQNEASHMAFGGARPWYLSPCNTWRFRCTDRKLSCMHDTARSCCGSRHEALVRKERTHDCETETYCSVGFSSM